MKEDEIIGESNELCSLISFLQRYIDILVSKMAFFPNITPRFNSTKDIIKDIKREQIISKFDFRDVMFCIKVTH